MKIIFTGAQGTGKTTILDYFKNQNYNVITEVVRKLSKEGVNINEMGDVEGQRKIFNTYVELFDNNNEYVSDRGLTDVLSYTMYLSASSSSTEYDELLDEQYNKLKEYCELNKDAIFFYFPIEFSVVDDGVRSTSDEFRKMIDSYILGLLKELEIHYYEVRGTIEERINFVKSIIESKNRF